MRRIIVVVLVAAFLVAVSAMSALAYTNFENSGNASDAPGQEQAQENCSDAISNQYSNANDSKGHKNAGNVYPANCDHYYQFLPPPKE